MDPVVGLTLAGYVIEARIGEGGMGLVYSGVQTEIGKRVAIKVIKADIGESADIVQRLIAEARAVNAIRHRGIVDIFGSAKLPDGRQAIIMEYLEGRSLEDALSEARAQGRTLLLPDVLQIADEVLSALSAAHQAGVIHRDLKPSNIFLCRTPTGEQHVKLLDFGIAKMGVVQETKASVVLGTPSYMAPEQARGESVGPALDLYAMGVILFELVTGSLPYTGDNAVRVIYQHLEAPIPTPSSRNPSLPGTLDAIIMRLLSKRSHERHGSADELRRELARLRVAVSDPSALKTIDEPIAPFDPMQPLEQTFVKARTPEPGVPPAVNGTGVLAPDVAARARTLASEVPDVIAPPVATPVAALASRGPPTADLAQSVKKSRAPLAVLGLLGAVVVAAVAWVARGSTEALPAVAAVAPLQVAQPEPVASHPTPTSVAEPQPPVEPTPVVEAKPVEPTTDAKADAQKRLTPRQRLQDKVRLLDRGVARAKKGGLDVQLLERQLTMVRSRLDTANSPDELEQLQVAVDRIAEELREN